MGSYISRFLAFSMVLVVSACSQDQAPPQGGGMPQMPPPPVTVAKVQQHELSEWREYTGRLEGSQSIVVKPRTSGYVVEVGFEDGQQVKKGDLLFQIDYRTIEAEVAQLKAEVVRAEAQIELADRDLKRAESLRATNALSQEQLDNRRTQV
ncbi:MAG: efflux RND transporter periplasmic adaptor subunit, partial [Oleiphilaceae bacterium]|nr:efflux RND transporter periplasmic adaptor subunit [Oleiphilaceae bacterium]